MGVSSCMQLSSFGQINIRAPEIGYIKDRIIQIATHGIQDDFDCEIMSNSLFYYCCGKDPTPIAAFGESLPLYVYVDFLYGRDFRTEIDELYHRLSLKGFKTVELCAFNANVKDSYSKNMNQGARSELSVWKTRENNTFFLLYVKGDADDTLDALYTDNRQGLILPKCICNLLYEGCHRSISQIEKRTEYILGHWNQDKYKKVGEVEYLGDYGWEKAELWHRRFYYWWSY
ncbi:hypothetical protein J6253_01580 [bacterium]|nr:hypothetical protein [bacterium]MBP5590323.1 hypothetical protein [bacterium]